MAEFALLIADAFQEIRNLPEQPVDIPHKQVVWLPVAREYGQPFEGVEGDAYVVRTVNPATLPPPVPSSVPAAKARLALLQAGLLDRVEAAVAGADRETQIMWEYEATFHIDHPKIVDLGTALGLPLEDLFRAASVL